MEGFDLKDMVAFAYWTLTERKFRLTMRDGGKGRDREREAAKVRSDDDYGRNADKRELSTHIACSKEE